MTGTGKRWSTQEVCDIIGVNAFTFSANCVSRLVGQEICQCWRCRGVEPFDESPKWARAGQLITQGSAAEQDRQRRARESATVYDRPAGPPSTMDVILRICTAAVDVPPTGGHALDLESLAVILRGEGHSVEGVMGADMSTVAAWAYVLRDLPEVQDGVRWFFDAAAAYGIRPTPVDRCDPRNRKDWGAVWEILGEDWKPPGGPYVSAAERERLRKAGAQ